VDDCTGWLVDCRAEPCFGATETFADLFTAQEDWWSADVNHLRRCMRIAYQDHVARGEKAAEGKRRAGRFSYGAVGRLMAGLLAGGSDGREKTELAGLEGQVRP